ASEPRPAASRNGQARPPAAGPKPALAGQRTAPHARSRDLPGRKPAGPQREAATGREAVSRREEAMSRREPERETASRREPEREAVPGRRPAARREAVTERLPGRPRQQPPAAARNDAPLPLRPDTAPTPPAGQPSLAMLTSLASGPPGGLEDDPLT